MNAQGVDEAIAVPRGLATVSRARRLGILPVAARLAAEPENQMTPQLRLGRSVSGGRRPGRRHWRPIRSGCRIGIREDPERTGGASR